MSSYKLFSDLDKDRHGRVVSEYPAWYFETHLENMDEEINSTERRLKEGRVPLDQVEYTKAELAAMREKREAIEKARPKLSDIERGKLWKIWKEELCPAISESMFTRTDMKKGLADAHEEARRMVRPCIPVAGTVAELVEACAGTVVKGKVSRNTLARTFKIVAKLLGESANIEYLRKDRLTEAIKVE